MAKEDEQNSGQHQPEHEPKFNQHQYDLLKRCSDKKDMTEWNEWRELHQDEDIWLQGADLKWAYLENADLKGAHLENAILKFAHLKYAKLYQAHLEKARLEHAHLENANLEYAHLEKVNLMFAHLENANLELAHMEKANLQHAHMEKANLQLAYMEKASIFHTHLEYSNLKYAQMEKVSLGYTNLVNANLMGINLQGAMFDHTNLEGACFLNAIVDGHTLFVECELDRKTDFRCVGLDSARIGPATKQLLEYNARRTNWEEWYRGKSKNKWIIKLHQFLTCPVRLFWSFSNYGLSTWRIIFTFFALAFVFAVVCWQWPNFVAFNGKPGVDNFEGLWHSFYFSVVTMTTLGFGDIAANPDSWKGQGLLMLQVLLGYVLLGALVTRFAVLFTAGGPAGKFSKSKTKEKKKTKRAKNRLDVPFL